MSETKTDIYSRITNRIVADLERGVRPWHQPWNAEHGAGRIIRPLRSNGLPYKGINVVMLWSAAVTKGHAPPLWLTFRQALELGGNVKKGERGELVVYADRITRTETDAKGGDRTLYSLPQRLHRVQRRTMRRPAHPLLCEGGGPCPALARPYRGRWRFRCRDRR